MTTDPPAWETLIHDTDSGEPFWNGYTLWNGRRILVRRSDLMLLRTNMDLYLNGTITAKAAKANEMFLAHNGWVWIDKVVEPRPMNTHIAYNEGEHE